MNEKATLSTDTIIHLCQKAIGSFVDYEGQQWRIIEYLSEENKLVLQNLSQPTIQSSAFGDARRLVADTLTINVFDPNPTLTAEIRSILDQLVK